jgi:SAM-dependent methyltransferase
MQLDYQEIKKFWRSRAKIAAQGGRKAVNLGTTPLQHQKQLQILLKHIGPTDRRFVELGCGTGRITLFLAPWAEEIVAVDFCKPILNVLRQELLRKKIKNVKTFCANAYDKLPVAYGRYDVVLIFGIILHLNDPEWIRTILNAKRLLKPSGKIMVRESVGLPRHFEVDKYSKELRAYYKAIYRTPKHIETTFRKCGLETAISKKLYQQRKETGTWFWVFTR